MKKTLFALSAFALVLLGGCSSNGKRDKKHNEKFKKTNNVRYLAYE